MPRKPNGTSPLFSETATLERKIPLPGGLFLLIFRAPAVATHARPGQFLMVRLLGLDPLLPRPMSYFHAGKSRVWLLLKPYSRGTLRITALGKGDAVQLIGPLGVPFPRFEKVLLVGGGTGLAPLHFYARRYPQRVAAFVVGFRTHPGDRLLALLQGLHVPLALATEDGSLGVQGTVLDALTHLEVAPELPVILCGPTPMMRAVAERFPPDRTYVSLETPMACGTGVCMGCAVERADGKGYLRPCTEGPLFRLSEIRL